MAMALSPDGRCKTFDETANGFGRSDGVGSLTLELGVNKACTTGSCASRAV